MNKTKEERRWDTKNWGKDHWSLLAYFETIAVDYDGKVDVRRIRINSTKRGYSNGNISSWQDTWGTIMKGGIILDTQHDDIDVMNDLEEAGLVKNVSTELNPIIEMTEKGREIVGNLRKHKSNGGVFGNFNKVELL